MSRHTITLTEPLFAQGIELCSFGAWIAVNYIPPSGDGWNSPRERGHYELDSVGQADGPYIPSYQLTVWAEAWVENNQAKIHDRVQWAGEPF